MLRLQKIRHFYLFVCLFIYYYTTYLSLLGRGARRQHEKKVNRSTLGK